MHPLIIISFNNNSSDLMVTKTFLFQHIAIIIIHLQIHHSLSHRNRYVLLLAPLSPPTQPSRFLLCNVFVALPESLWHYRLPASRARWRKRDVSDHHLQWQKWMHFHHIYSHYNLKQRRGGFSFVIESRQWGVKRPGFSIEAGSCRRDG